MRRGTIIAMLALCGLTVLGAPTSAQSTLGLAAVPPPVDPQSWALPEWLTWDDYNAIPGVDWNSPALQPPKKIRAALILGEFADRPFVVTQPQGSDVFAVDAEWASRVPGYTGPVANPTVGGVPRDQVGDFYNELLITTPSPLNHMHTINEYWLEDSYGTIGVDGTAFGPYTMDFKEHEYGLGGSDAGGAGSACPAGDTCGRGFDNELISKSLADVTAGQIANGEDYDFRWLLHSAYDESGTWQEFGEIYFPGPDDVPDRFGPPNAADLAGNQGNASSTRYVDFSSWAASEGIWSHATPGVYSTQGESDGSSVFAHELSHIFGVLDNYNNPYGNPVRRSYSGPWDMLSRGAFNGPGGPHTRWQIPALNGASMGSHHMVRNKLRLGFMKPNELMVVTRDSLRDTGPAFATIYPRAYPLAPITAQRGLHGLQVSLAGGDRSPSCSTAQDHACDGGGYNDYTMEFVEQIGHDSFTHDSGVLLAKNKPADTAPFIWVIDAHPGDINEESGVGRFSGREVYDFIRPGTGEKAPISLGDYRQLADALFHAGTGEGVVSEYVDEANRLHFYILEKATAEGVPVPTYRVAVRSLDGAGPLPRSVAVQGLADGQANPGRVATVQVTVTNNGLTPDLYRLSHTSDRGWPTFTAHQVIEVPAASSKTVDVHVIVPVTAAQSNPSFAQVPGAGAVATVTFTATSETAPSATATTTRRVTAVGPPAQNPAPTPAAGGGAPQPAPTIPGENPDLPPAEDRPLTITRVEGEGRIETAVALSNRSHPDGADEVVVARADDFPDALTGAPLATSLSAPLLLTRTASLPEQLAAEIRRLGPDRVTILGGTSAVSAEVEAQIAALGVQTRRVSGQDRYDTSAAIAATTTDATGQPVYLASGENFPDALSVAPLAAHLGRPVLLTRAGGLPEDTIAALAALDPSEVVLVGGEAAISPEVVAQLEAEGYQVRRLSGQTRYETSAAVADEALVSGMSVDPTFLATGEDFPDALSAGPLVARGGSLLLVDRDRLSDSAATSDALVRRADLLTEVVLVGGPAALDPAIEAQVREQVEGGRSDT